ncbi:MAG: PaaI family thioesterase [Deltaproteobacteria bacterium]|nr:PaaI family thioesterase [Deltaproteobacteria bacterium]MBW1819074.1 PaaI family thioesterase [Deltaproteobacteria bacterium]MBW2285346.1 PaaI family thioesterase [Deltaproteobacteria bacterium]
MRFSEADMKRLNDNTVYRTVGIEVTMAEGGEAMSRLRPNPELCWPFQGQPHGGVLATLMDTTMAWTVLTVVDPGYNCATINLDIQYTRPARGDLTCRSRVKHSGGRIVYTTADIHDADGRLVATGQGTFRVIREPAP